MLITGGSAIVRNSILPKGRRDIHELRVGELFGDSDLLRYPGIDFLGDIYAGENGLECLVLVAPEMIVDHFEIPSLRVLLLERYEFLKE